VVSYREFSKRDIPAQKIGVSGEAEPSRRVDVYYKGLVGHGNDEQFIASRQEQVAIAGLLDKMRQGFGFLSMHDMIFAIKSESHTDTLLIGKSNVPT